MKNVLVVTAHHRRDSLTFAVSDRISSILSENHKVENADLFQEGFDPVLTTPDDPDWNDSQKTYSSVVMSEFARIRRNDASIIIFPVWWWSMPALLKGWIDRVWNNGLAYGVAPFPQRKVWMVGVAGNDAASFAKRDYDSAMITQIETGILGYCGIEDRRLELLYGSMDSEEDCRRILSEASSVGRRFADSDATPELG